MQCSICNYLITLIMLLFLSGCSDKAENKFIGKWMSGDHNLELFEDHSLAYGPSMGNWAILKDGRLKLTYHDQISLGKIERNMLVLECNGNYEGFAKVKKFNIHKLIYGKWVALKSFPVRNIGIFDEYEFDKNGKAKIKSSEKVINLSYKIHDHKIRIVQPIGGKNVENEISYEFNNNRLFLNLIHPEHPITIVLVQVESYD